MATSGTITARTPKQGSSVRLLVKAATDAVHTQLDSWPLVAALMDGTATRREYTAFLAATYGYRAAIEAALAPFDEPLADWVNAVDCRAASLLSGDLAALSQQGAAPAPAVSVCVPPTYSSVYSALGGWYVLVGSSNGNRLIRRAIAAQDAAAGWPTHYLDASTDSHSWRAVCHALEAAPKTESDVRQIIDGALATFQAIRNYVL